MKFRSEKFYSYDNLLKVAESRGYMTESAVARSLAPYFNLTEGQTKTKLASGRLNIYEAHFIGAYFEMSPKEFCDVFCDGLFVETSVGRFVCHIDDLDKHIAPLPKKKTKRKTKEKTIAEILDEIDRL